MDGLAAGTSVVIAVLMGAVAFETLQPAIGWATAAIAGCLPRVLAVQLPSRGARYNLPGRRWK